MILSLYLIAFIVFNSATFFFDRFVVNVYGVFDPGPRTRPWLFNNDFCFNRLVPGLMVFVGVYFGVFFGVRV